MKLLFPNEEHTPVELRDGTMVVGSSIDCEVRLHAATVAEHHCELISERGQTRVHPLTESAATVLNGKQISGEATLKAGDLLLFGKVGCRVVAAGRSVLPPAAPADDDMGHTRVRMAMPKFLLRGVSGPTFGKVYAVVGAMTVGRSSDCGICIPIDEISRQHAKLQSAADGVVVEDLGSANGTFVNGQRVHTGTLLKAGDEVRFDTVRFLMMSPSQEAQASAAAQQETAIAPAGSTALLWVGAGIAVVVALALAALRYFGMI
jgi:pSer/pThr/pTyr-binding forkhead associated (FHA) protein